MALESRPFLSTMQLAFDIFMSALAVMVLIILVLENIFTLNPEQQAVCSFLDFSILTQTSQEKNICNAL